MKRRTFLLLSAIAIPAVSTAGVRLWLTVKPWSDDALSLVTNSNIRELIQRDAGENRIDVDTVEAFEGGQALIGPYVVSMSQLRID